jgi:multidrug efflux pump subunit AcrA (membrane-fusion protein)
MGTVGLSRDSEPAKYSAILTPNAQVDLVFRVSGYVVELYQTIGADGRMRPLEPGAQVAAGTVLARVRPSDYQAVVDKDRGAQQEAEAGVAAAQAQLVQAQANLAQAELDFARVSALWEQTSITKPPTMPARRGWTSPKAQSLPPRPESSPRKDARRPRKPNCARQRFALEDTELRAPFHAIVLERRAELGALAAAGSVGFTLADLQTLKGRFNVPDFALEGFQPGQSLNLEINAFPGSVVRGRVLSLAAAADPKARSFEIEVAVPNAGKKLRSGTIATVRTAGGRPSPARLQVPASALVHDPTGQRYLVYTIEQHGGRARQGDSCRARFACRKRSRRLIGPRGRTENRCHGRERAAAGRPGQGSGVRSYGAGPRSG